MRPVTKPTCPTDADGNPIIFRPHTNAKPHLETGIGSYCSYCEEFHSNLQVEHVISKKQDSSKIDDWDNFLMGCSRCNGKDNKSDKPVNLDEIHFPHLDNSLLSFCYLEGGKVIVNPLLAGSIEETKAQNLMDLVGLDKYPGNPKYPKVSPKDMRWATRRSQWETAARKLQKFRSGEIEVDEIAELATQRGYFSIWYTLFADHPAVRKALISAFNGTARDCFDPANNYQPVPRQRA